MLERVNVDRLVSWSLPLEADSTKRKGYFLIIKPTRCINFSNLFLNVTLHVSDRFSVHHQESSTVYTKIDICHTGYAECLLAGSGWN